VGKGLLKIHMDEKIGGIMLKNSFSKIMSCGLLLVAVPICLVGVIIKSMEMIVVSLWFLTDMGIIRLLFNIKTRRHPNMLLLSNYFKGWKAIYDNGGIGMGHCVYKFTGHKILGLIADSIAFVWVVNYLAFPGLFWW